MTTEVQRKNVRKAAPALSHIAGDHELVLSHGNGPQVGLLALQAAAYTDAEPSTLDVLGAQTQGMIAYVLEQELRNYFPPTERFATILTMVEVDKDDPAFANPTKFVGPIYPEEQAKKLAEEKGWPFRKDGESWRRVVPSPLPQHIFELEAIKALLDLDIVVICTGGGGIPTLVTEADGKPFLSGVEAVIDKDFNLGGLSLGLDFKRSRQLAFMPLAQPEVTSQHDAGKQQGADQANQQPAAMTPLFVLERKWVGFQLI